MLPSPAFVARKPALAVPETAASDLRFAKFNGMVTGFKANLASFQAIAASTLDPVILHNSTVARTIVVFPLITYFL